MAYLRDRRAFGNIGTRKFRGARFGDPLSPRGPQYTKEGRVLDYSTDVGPFTIVDQSGESNTATLYSGRGLTMDAVNDTVTYDTTYTSASRTATAWMRVTALGARTLNGATGTFTFTPTATNTWEELSSTATVSGDLAWTAGSDCDIGDLTCATEHWTHNDWSDPTGDTSNGKTIVDSGPNQLHGTCTGCSGFTGEGIDPEVAGIVGLDDARWFNGTDSYVNLGAGDPLGFNGSGRIDFGCNVVIGAIPTSTEDIFYQYINANGVGFAVDMQSSGQVRVSGRSVSADSFQSLLSTTLATVGETRIDAYIDYANDEIGISLNAGAYKTGSAVFGQTSFTYGSSTNNTRIGNSQAVARFFTGSVFNVEIQEDSVASNSYTGRGTSVTAWEDTIGSNDGTESGTFVTVGQKRATIPQTVDKNWNKYQYFNGVDTGVLMGNVFDYTDNFSIEATFSTAAVGISALASRWESAGASVRQYLLRLNSGVVQFYDSTSTGFFRGANLNDGARHSVKLVINGASSFIEIDGVQSGATFSPTITSEAVNFVGGATYSTVPSLTGFFNGLIWNLNIVSGGVPVSAYTGLGNDPWKDTIGSNNGTEAGTFTRELVTASDANIQIDALGTAISAPRLNTQQLNLFGEGEYSSTPDSASLDLTTTATWEIWGNFYGVYTTNPKVFSKYSFGSGDERSWQFLKNANKNAGDFDLVLGDASGLFAATVFWSGIPDATGMLSVTFNAGALVGYFNGISLGSPTIRAGTIPVSLFESTADVMIGTAAALVYFYDNKIGSAKIYNVALTADEVLTNYETQKSLYGL